MKKIILYLLAGAGLIGVSVLLYYFHYLIFNDPHHIFIYMLGDMAFVPIEVLMVTLIIDRLLQNREKKLILQKLNMVIGVFFSELGTELLIYLSDSDPNLDKIKKDLIITNEWTEKEFKKTEKSLKNREYKIHIEKIDLERLESLLLNKRRLLIKILENPILLEHESFTELLKSVFHLQEELSARRQLNELNTADKTHLKGDIERVYGHLVFEWIEYMKHLKNEYPYLFSFAMRTNPFDETAEIEFK